LTTWSTESVDLARVVAASHTEDQSCIGQVTGYGMLFRRAERMPNRGNGETAADLDALGTACDVHGHHRQASVAFGLKVMLGHPQCLESQLLEQFSQLRRSM